LRLALYGLALGTIFVLALILGAIPSAQEARGHATSVPNSRPPALAQMAVARRLAKDHAGQLLPQRVQGLEEFLQRSGTIAVMESRIVPFLPYGVVNYAAGLTRLGYREMAVGTLIGAAPKVFAYVALGGSISNLNAVEVKVAIGLLVVLGVIGLVVVKRQMNAEAAAAGP